MLQWFAIRVTYSRELIVKSYLDSCDVQSYVPMHFTERTIRGETRKIWVPLIHNLLFVRTTARRLRELKAGTDLPIRYIMNPESKSPTVIPDRQMDDFIAVVATQDAHVEIVAAGTELAQGDRVRVTDGIFKGIEGHYIRHKGHSKVAVAIHDVATALTAYVPIRFVERLPDDPS